MINCAYCEKTFATFSKYKCHLKILHSKGWHGDRIICGQGGCPLDYMSAQKLQKHIEQHHSVLPSLRHPHPSCSAVADEHMNRTDIAGSSMTDDETESEHEDSTQFVANMMDEIQNKGALDAAAIFVSKLRSNPKMPLSVSLEITESCKELFSTMASNLKLQTDSLLQENNIDPDSSKAVLDTIAIMTNPFTGLETLHKQTNYFKRNGFYIAPHTFTVGQQLLPVASTDGVSYKTQTLTGEYVRQTDFFKAFLTIPGVLHEIITYLDSRHDSDLICDFKDGTLWQNHPIRLRHLHSANTVVIPVFDFFDDVETVNPLGSHATIHKVGCKYTIIKGCMPACNSKLENLPLNMIFKSSDRSLVSNKQILDVYLSEMTELESHGVQIELDGTTFQVYICLVQVIGDNLGLNSLLGFVESFTATYPCRLCKVKREDFSRELTETDKLRTRESYEHDVSIHDYRLTGVKEECSYNAIPSFHVSQNVSCDIMHDLLEGVCRYVMLKIIKYLVISKAYFSLDTLNHRISIFKYDHSSPPNCISLSRLKGDTLIMGAMEMLNLVLGFALMVGDLVPEDDCCWDVYILLRQTLLFSCGLCFSTDELQYMRTLIAEFLGQYIKFFDCSVSLKFHNLTHYPSIIAALGPLYFIWVMRCEAKHAEAKKVASCSGNFKNICRTIATRHQMKQAARLMSQKGIGGMEVSLSKCDSAVLSDFHNGNDISALMGNYGMYRDVYTTHKVTVNSVHYTTGHALIADTEDMFPRLVFVDRILLTDTRDVYFICHQLEVLSENRHFQAYEVKHTDALAIIPANRQHSWPSPWPLHLRLVQDVAFVSLRHKIWCDNISVTYTNDLNRLAVNILRVAV